MSVANSTAFQPQQTYSETNFNETSLNFLPSECSSSVKNRINVTEPEEKIEESMKTANIWEQIAIIHDLLIAGRKKETDAEKRFQAFAAELYIKSPDEVRKVFLKYVAKAPTMLKNFSSALLTNCISHDDLPSGFTEEELKYEVTFALNLAKYLQKASI